MAKSEREIQDYIWENREHLCDFIPDVPPNSKSSKKPWEYEPWELLYEKIISEYYQELRYLKGLNLFGCEVGLPKEGENTIRSDFFGCIDGANGFVVCELKVNPSAERQAYTELFAYGNYIRSKFAPMGKRDILYLLISPMEERIVREATICNLLYDRNRVVALIPKWNDDEDTLQLDVWIPEKEEFKIISKTSFAFTNIETTKVVWRCPGKWSPLRKGKKPTRRMIHQLNQVASYAAQIMESKGINGFAYCSQLYPQYRDEGWLENSLVICGINPFKSAKTRFLYQHGCNLKDAAETKIDYLSIFNMLPNLKNKSKEVNEDSNYWEEMGASWSSALDQIAFDVRNSVILKFVGGPIETDYGMFDWDSYLNNSGEDFGCWNYDIHLTGVLREIYDLKLQKHYAASKDYSLEEKGAVVDSGLLEPYYIDMLNSQDHVREFLRSVTEGAEDDVLENPGQSDIESFEYKGCNLFPDNIEELVKDR